MIIACQGQYYIRDLGVVHKSRLRLDDKLEVQIQKGTVVDLGKVVHYHFDKVLHKKAPSQDSSETFYKLRPSEAYEIDSLEPATLRAKKIYANDNEGADTALNEIIIDEEEGYKSQILGKSKKRADIQIVCKAVSNDHCKITYSDKKGWVISEKDKDKLSTGGTYVFMKSMQQ